MFTCIWFKYSSLLMTRCHVETYTMTNIKDEIMQMIGDGCRNKRKVKEVCQQFIDRIHKAEADDAAICATVKEHCNSSIANKEQRIKDTSIQITSLYLDDGRATSQLEDLRDSIATNKVEISDLVRSMELMQIMFEDRQAIRAEEVKSAEHIIEIIERKS